MFERRHTSIDRRSGRDRRKVYHLARFFYRAAERRSRKEQRSEVERRKAWVKVSDWSAVNLRDLKIGKFLT